MQLLFLCNQEYNNNNRDRGYGGKGYKRGKKGGGGGARMNLFSFFD